MASGTSAQHGINLRVFIGVYPRPSDPLLVRARYAIPCNFLPFVPLVQRIRVLSAAVGTRGSRGGVDRWHSIVCRAFSFIAWLYLRRWSLVRSVSHRSHAKRPECSVLLHSCHTRARYLFLIYPARSRFSQFHSRIIPHPLANTCCYPAQKKFDCPIKFRLSPRTLRFDPMGISVLWKRRHPNTAIPSLLKIKVLFLYA